MQVHICPCGKTVTSSGPGRPRLYCGECSRERRSAAAKKRHARVYVPRSQLTAEELAAVKAEARRKWKGACSRCGNPMHVGPRSLPPDQRMCADCRGIQGPRAMKVSRVCVLCEEPYTLKPKARPDQRWCSKSCAQAWRNGARPPYQRDVVVGMPRKVKQSRIRRLRRAQTWDGVTDEQILERDRWRCGICGKRIGKSFRYPHPRSKSVDHVIPLSQGGDDTAANKRAAHLGCNNGRMNRGGGEQLAMIG